MTSVLPSATGERALELDRTHVFHSWSAQARRTALVIDGAAGSYVWDPDGKRYLDFSSQLVFTNIGHQHPAVVAAIQEQVGRLSTAAPQFAVGVRGEAARLISELAPDGMSKVFFTNGGAEAVENAVRMARLHTGRYKVLTRYRSYHGGTQTAITMTGDPRRWASDPWGAGVVHFSGPFRYRSEFAAQTEEEECERALRHLEHVIRMEGPATIAAVVLETVPGTAGIMVPPPGYLTGVRRLCDEHGILLVLDEVMAGFGRTGQWWARDHVPDVVPDLMTFAKGVTSGYVPLGGVVLGDHVAATFDERPYPGGLTYSGHPLACAAAVATITAMRAEGIVANARRIGESVLGPGLRALAERHPVVGEVRGLGVFWALELVSDRASKQPLAPYGGTSPAMKALVAACTEGGLLPFSSDNRVHVVPPCTISDDEARDGLAILDEALAVADRHYTG